MVTLVVRSGVPFRQVSAFIPLELWEEARIRKFNNSALIIEAFKQAVENEQMKEQSIPELGGTRVS